MIADLTLIYNVHCSLTQHIESLSSEDSSKADLKERLEDKLKVHFDYLGHLLCTKHQGEYYQFVQKNLKPGECVVVIDLQDEAGTGQTEQGDSARLVWQEGVIPTWLLCCRQIRRTGTKQRGFRFVV